MQRASEGEAVGLSVLDVGKSEQVRQASTAHGIVLMLASVMPVMAVVSLVPVLPALIREFSDVPASAILVPMAITIPALCVSIFSPIAGWMSDRLGRKWLLVGGLVVYAFVGVVPLFLDKLLHIIAARVVVGLAEAVIMTVATTLIADYFQGALRERWIAAQIAVVSGAAVVLIALGGGLAELLGSRGPFVLYVLALPVALVSALFLFEPDLETNERLGGRIAFPLLRLLPLFFATLVGGILFYTVIVKLGPILQVTTEGVSAGSIGLVGAAVNAGIMFGAFIFHKLTDSSGPRLMMIGFFLSALGYAGMAFSADFTAAAIFAVVSSIGAGLLLPTFLNWVVQLLPEPMRGRGTGIWTGIFFFGQFCAPLLASAAEGPLGGLANVLLVWAGAAVLFSAVALGGVLRGAKAIRDLAPV